MDRSNLKRLVRTLDVRRQTMTEQEFVVAKAAKTVQNKSLLIDRLNNETRMVDENIADSMEKGCIENITNLQLVNANFRESIAKHEIELLTLKQNLSEERVQLTEYVQSVEALTQVCDEYQNQLDCAVQQSADIEALDQILSRRSSGCN